MESTKSSYLEVESVAIAISNAADAIRLIGEGARSLGSDCSEMVCNANALMSVVLDEASKKLEAAV